MTFITGNAHDNLNVKIALAKAEGDIMAYVALVKIGNTTVEDNYKIVDSIELEHGIFLSQAYMRLTYPEQCGQLSPVQKELAISVYELEAKTKLTFGVPF